MKKLFLIFCSVFFLSCVIAQEQDSAQLLEKKIEQEKEVKQQVQNILDRALGIGHNSIISVNIEYVSGGEVTKRKEHKPMQKDDDRPWLLPGIPNIQQRTTSGSPADEYSVETRTLPKWKKKIGITVDQKYADDVINQLRDTLIKQLGLNLKEGDSLDINRLQFQGGQLVGSLFGDKWNILLLMAGIAMMVFTVFLFGPIRAFLRSILNTLQEGRGRQVSVEMGGAGSPMGGATGVLTGGPAGAITAGGKAQIEGASTKATGEAEKEAGAMTAEEGGIAIESSATQGKVKIFRPFSFIKKSNIPNLVYLVQEEQPEIIALILSYLNPDEAADLMTQLPTELQGKVALSMATVKQASHESVARAEETIKKKIDFLVGGLERFTGIIDRLDKETRDEILSALAKESPALVERVRREIFTFENITDLDDTALQLVLREIKTNSLARALMNADENIVSKIKTNISTGAATLLDEEMSLTGYLTAAQIEEERRRVVEIVRKLEKDGKILLKKVKRKTEKVEHIEHIGESSGIASLPAGSGEVTVGSRKESPAATEKKVSLKDYESRMNDRGLSMSSIFKETAAKSGSKPKQQDEEKLFETGKKKPQAQNPEKAKEFYTEGTKAYNSRNYDSALEKFKKSVENNPNLWQAFQGLGNCYTAKGMAKEAIDAYETALKLNPANAGLKEWLEKYKAKNA